MMMYLSVITNTNYINFILLRVELDNEYKHKIRRGDYPVDEPPSCFEVSNMLCQQMLCCATETPDKTTVKERKSDEELERRRSRIKSVHSLTGINIYSNATESLHFFFIF